MTHRRLKSWTAAAILLAAAGVFSGCATSPSAKSAKHAAAGKALLEKGDSARAILQFQNAARLTPRDPEIYYQLATAYLAASDTRSGIAALRKTLELDAKHAGARLRMAQLMASVNDPEFTKQAQDRVRELLQETPNDADALHTLAFIEMKLGEMADATAHLERAFAEAPQELSHAVALAQAKLLQRDVAGAEAVLKKLSADSPKSSEAATLLGRFYRTIGRMQDGERELRRAVDLDGNNARALLSLAVIHKDSGRKDEAEREFKRVSTLPEKSLRHSYAMYLFEAGRNDEAIRELERLWKQDPADRSARQRLMAGYQVAGRGAEAQKVLAATLAKNPKDLDALLQRAELSMAAGKYADAEADLNRVIQLKPDSAEARFSLAKLYGLRGEAQREREQLAEAVKLNPYLVPVRLELARLLIANKSGAAALELLDSAPASEKLALLLQRNWALWSLGKTQEMRSGIDAALAKQRSPEALIQDGVWKLNQGNAAGARASLEEALQIDPGNLRALDALNRSYQRTKDAAAALPKIKEYAARQPRSAPVQEFLGLMLWAHGDLGDARKAFEGANAASGGSSAAELSLIQLDILEKKWDSAQSRLAARVKANGGDARARLWLGNILEFRGDHKGAVEQFRKAVDLQPNNADALNNLAYLLIEQENRLDEGLKYAQRAQELSPDDPDIADTIGWVLYRKGLYSAAVKQLERAAAREGKSAWKYHLAMAYAKSGDVRRGRTVLDAALRRDPKAPEAGPAKQVVNETK